jgi:hypothetical protein
MSPQQYLNLRQHGAGPAVPHIPGKTAAEKAVAARALAQKAMADAKAKVHLVSLCISPYAPSPVLSFSNPLAPCTRLC